MSFSPLVYNIYRFLRLASYLVSTHPFTHFFFLPFRLSFSDLRSSFLSRLISLSTYLPLIFYSLPPLLNLPCFFLPFFFLIFLTERAELYLRHPMDERGILLLNYTIARLEIICLSKCHAIQYYLN